MGWILRRFFLRTEGDSERIRWPLLLGKVAWAWGLLCQVGVSSGFSAELSGPCDYPSYRPQTLAQVILARLAQRKLVTVPSSVEIHNLTPGNLPILRASEMVAQYAVEEDIRAGSSSLVFYDMDAKTLMAVHEKTYPCPPKKPMGRCRQLEFTSEIDEVGDTPPLTMIVFPHRPPLFHRYDRDVSVLKWREGLGEMLDWLEGTLDRPKETYPVLVKGAEQRLYIALASDPFLNPYVPSLVLKPEADQWVIGGRVPSDAYRNRIWNVARAAGYVKLKYLVTVDEKTYKKPPQLPSANCYR